MSSTRSATSSERRSASAKPISNRARWRRLRLEPSQVATGWRSIARVPDELLSSWLWRVARGIGAPLRRFVLDAIGARLADVDRDIDDATIDRLAFLSGQTREHLLRGTMRPDAGVDPSDERGEVQQALLQHGNLALNHYRGGRGRSVPMTQYCPVCLCSEHSVYLRRG